MRYLGIMDEVGVYSWKARFELEGLNPDKFECVAEKRDDAVATFRVRNSSPLNYIVRKQERLVQKETKQQPIRRVIFRPYVAGAHDNISFTLTLWDTNRVDANGKSILKYRLTQSVDTHKRLPSGRMNRKDSVLFEGEDFACSPLHATNSNRTLLDVMSFLTKFAGTHSEALASEVEARFGEKVEA